jgi:hypothetical protein
MGRQARDVAVMLVSTKSSGQRWFFAPSRRVRYIAPLAVAERDTTG